MFSKRKYLLPLIIIVLVLLALVLKKQKSTLNRNEKDFSFTQIEKANRIEIITPENSFQLQKTNDNWSTNDENTANLKTINKLFSVLENIQILSPVLTEHKIEYTKLIEQSGTSLKIYSNKKLLYELRFANNLNKNYLITKSGNLYYISIRGYGKALLSDFTKTKISDWYDKVLINLEPKEITSILLEFTESNEPGFKIDNNQTIRLLNSKNKIEEIANSESITDYLHFFSGIKYALIDTIQQIPNPNKQLFRLNINTNIEKNFHIVGFELVEKKTLQPSTAEFVGIINNSLMVKLSYSDFDPILVDLDYFLKN